MLESTFQLARAVGPRREAALWRTGIACWRDLARAEAAAVRGRAAARLRAAVDDAATALEKRNVAALARMLPTGEHWRLTPMFGDDAVFLDIETGDDDWGREQISAIGFCDRDGPRLLLPGRDLEAFPAIARSWRLLVTFNGSSFDVPVLRRAFPEWTPPAAHIDLRHVLARLGHHGGLKAIENELATLGLARPARLRQLDGWAAAGLYRRARAGDRAALSLFAEYNLYDVVNLRTLLAYAYNGLSAAEVTRAPALAEHITSLPIPRRGDVLYDISKILLSLDAGPATGRRGFAAPALP
jgi:uncharacterized protein